MLCRVYTLLVSFFVLTTCSLGFAQSAQVQGQVSDKSGAVIPRASVRVVDQRTGAERITETNGSGQYSVPGLNPSLYKVFVQAPGFSGAISDPITLNIAQNAVLDFRLQVGSGTQEVTVSASDLDINTTDASVSTVIDRQFVENLPMNGRSFQSLIYLTPGVSLNYGTTGSDQGQFTVNGQRASANYWTVDGVSANVGISVWQGTGNGAAGALGGFDILGGTSSLVSVDALQEFRIETSTYAPEFGRTPGGQIAITTRPGTNRFHGTVFDYFRNTVLDAEDWFADHNGLPKAPEQQNDFGGVLGGPIRKDKSFFFFSYEGFRLNQPTTLLATVPDLNARQIAIPAMQPYFNAYPLPNGPEVLDSSGNPTGLASANSAFSDPSKLDAFSLRIDHKLANSVNLFGRYSHSPSVEDTRALSGYTANNITPSNIDTDTVTAGTTWTASSDIVNETRFNYSQSGGKSYFYMDNFGGGSVPPLSSQFPSPFNYQNSEILYLPLFGKSMDYDIGLAAQNAQYQYNVVDTLSWQKNTHSLKFGADYRRLSPHRSDYEYAPVPLFATLDQMEQGKSSGIDLLHHLPGTFLFHNLGVYAQDTWRMSPRLTLTYGLRWDIDFQPSTETGPPFPAVTGFSYTDLSNLALAPVGTRPYQTPYGGFAPRIGGAYQLRPSSDHPLVLRGGFGIFYDLASSETGNVSGYQYPFGVSGIAPTNQFPEPPAAILQVPQIAPPDASQGVLQGFDPHLNLPYTLEWNVALEQGLGKGETLTVSYLGSSGRRLMATETINNPNPNYMQAQLIGNAGTSAYNALQAQFRRNLTNGLQALVSYTWSHSIDTGSYGAYANGSFADINMNRGNSDFDIRNTFSAALTYNVPTPTSNALMKAVLGGWSTDNIFQTSSAPPVTVNDAQFTALELTNASVSIRPDVVPGKPLYLHGSQYPGNKALNPAAFANPPVNSAGQPTRQGDSARNSLRAFGVMQWNFSVHREFSIRESVKLQFRSEMFNVLNHPNFGQYDVNFNPTSPDPYFGQSTQMLGQSLIPYGFTGEGAQSPLYNVGAPRSIQLALKLTF